MVSAGTPGENCVKRRTSFVYLSTLSFRPPENILVRSPTISSPLDSSCFHCLCSFLPSPYPISNDTSSATRSPPAVVPLLHLTFDLSSQYLFLTWYTTSAAMVYSLSYRRPPHVGSSRSSLNGSEKTDSIGGSTLDSEGAVSFGIPDALSFDRIIAGGTCPVSPNLILTRMAGFTTWAFDAGTYVQAPSTCPCFYLIFKADMLWNSPVPPETS